jgi:hypothetical protein
MNRFDRVLWRINGVFFFIALGALFWGITSSFRYGSFHRSRPPRRPDVALAKPANSDEILEFGDATSVKGTPFLRIPLNARGEGPDGPSFSKGMETRLCNYRFVDNNDLSAWWLFEGFNRLITHVHDLRLPESGNAGPVIATFYEVVSADTDGDHRLTQNDREAVYFSGPDGRKPKEIIPPTDGLLSFEQVRPEEILIIYRRDDSIVAGLFSLRNGTKIKETVIASSKAD